MGFGEATGRDIEISLSEKKESEMRVMNTDIFIKKASIKHNRFYSYDKSEFISNKTKIIISCPIHGDFLQTPNNHLSGYKCMKCSVDSRSKKRMDNKFIFSN